MRYVYNFNSDLKSDITLNTSTQLFSIFCKVKGSILGLSGFNNSLVKMSDSSFIKASSPFLCFSDRTLKLFRSGSNLWTSKRIYGTDERSNGSSLTRKNISSPVFSCDIIITECFALNSRTCSIQCWTSYSRRCLEAKSLSYSRVFWFSSASRLFSAISLLFSFLEVCPNWYVATARSMVPYATIASGNHVIPNVCSRKYVPNIKTNNSGNELLTNLLQSVVGVFRQMSNKDARLNTSAMVPTMLAGTECSFPSRTKNNHAKKKRDATVDSIPHPLKIFFMPPLYHYSKAQQNIQD